MNPMFDVLIGVIAAIICICGFAGGLLLGLRLTRWRLSAQPRGRPETPPVDATSNDEAFKEQQEYLAKTQGAFADMMRYNAELAYGLRDASSDGGDR